ncbi:MAG: O-antigen/teichoic acid export membrane protein [Flavobacteriaceae bacterium]|jgi:O-antigen/teichoic acid export membrane protein
MNKIRISISEFNKNVLTLMTGSSIAQAIPIAISPILTRIYTPDDFGILSLFVAITAILSVFVTGQYELAVMLPKNKKSSYNLIILAYLITFFISVLVLILIILFENQLLYILGNEKLGIWLYFIPISIFLTGVYRTQTYWLTYKKKFKKLAVNNIIRGGTSAFSNISIGVYKLSSSGLIASQLLAQCLAVLLLLKESFSKDDLSGISKIKMLAVARRYINFPKIIMFQSLFATISNNFPVLIVNHYFSLKTTGFYSFANKIIALPISLVSKSLYPVFFQEFSVSKSRMPFFKKKFKQINLIFAPIFVVIWFILPYLFVLVFGNEWRISGVYAQILLPLIYFKFLSNLFSNTIYIFFEKQFENFILSVLISFLKISSLLVGIYYNNLELGLILMVVTNIIVIVYKIHRSFQFVKKY